MNVFEIRTKMYMLKDVKAEDIQSEVSSIIDNTLSKEKKWLEFHKRNGFKNYCFDALYPLEKDKVYKKGNIYTLTIRTIDEDLAKYFDEKLRLEYSDSIKSLISESRIIPKKHISKIYSITPIIIKTGVGYWKGNLSLNEFENRIKINLIKKYNKINNTKISEDFELYNNIEMKNRKPCPIKYKNITLLGDKISLNISDDKIAQELAYMSLGTGLSELNSRGAGFVNFRYL